MTDRFCNHYTDSYYKVLPEFGNKVRKRLPLSMKLRQMKSTLDVGTSLAVEIPQLVSTI